jgi:two-component system, OmpR family, phosphate regulon sensor histidine kinase PhoR
MKKSTIWILGIVMGLSFISLLYLQVSYVEEMVKMRNEQFDESVKRSLYQVSKNLEYDETLQYLEHDVADTERVALSSQIVPQSVALNNKRIMSRFDKQNTPNVNNDFEIQLSRINPSGLPKALISNGHGSNSFSQTSKALQDAIKNRYQHQRILLDEVVLNILQTASNKDLNKRVNFKNLDGYLKSEFVNNGIDIPYHFMVTDQDGRVLYKCPDYDDEGSESSYSQILFPNDPPSRMSFVKVHFPTKKDYIFDSVSFMLPSLIFTIVLLIVSVFTIYTVFRQKKLTEMKNDFINNMTHEFKTPISTISLAAQMLKDPAVAKSPAMFQHISGVINDETKRLRFQVEKVLQMSMFERKVATLKMKEINANELIYGVINTFTLKVEKYGGKITSDLGAEDDAVFVDDMHFTNVIFNIMDNAVKYKKPETDLLLDVHTWNEGGKFCVSIADNGIGIKKESIKKVFDKFYRVHTGNLHDVKGFGLGLAYVKKIIEAQKGTIKLESEPGEGSKFIIVLPLLNI